MARHRIDFKYFDVIVMQVGSTGVIPQVLITWTIEPIRTGSDEITFHVERSPTPDFTDTDAIETLSLDIACVAGQTVYEYLDLTVNLQSFWRRYYYRIKVSDTSPARTLYSDTKTWESDPKIFELEIISRHNWLLMYETGTPCFALIERTAGGDHCQDCYNTSLARSNKSNCEICYGTGRERPYFQPILTYIDFNPPPEMSQIVNMGEAQQGQVDVWWSAYPKLVPGNLLVEVVSNARWRIANVSPIGDVRTSIQHFARLERLSQRDIKHQVAISDTDRKAAVTVLEDMKAERRF